ncbi:hypothetical protein PoB_007025800 [Plakobranchus ocellatus]|uniref:Uncharacterized protein n=1 Tax=Plakobranchus ocellatus TaxID=259542 RepID=A0AAV4DHP9_9GAST|nr:hypothetical protein PoB_007025800 [Plakobranchus ocellatus]
MGPCTCGPRDVQDRAGRAYTTGRGASLQQGGLRLLGPLSGQHVKGGARTCNRQICTDRRADWLSNVPPLPQNQSHTGNQPGRLRSEWPGRVSVAHSSPKDEKQNSRGGGGGGEAACRKTLPPYRATMKTAAAAAAAPKLYQSGEYCTGTHALQQASGGCHTGLNTGERGGGGGG